MRSSFVLADLERRGGVAQRMSPLATVSDCGALLQARLTLPLTPTLPLILTLPLIEGRGR